jgi:hypothetical protein
VRRPNTSQEEKEEQDRLNASAKSSRKLHKFHLSSSDSNFRHMKAKATKASLLDDIVSFLTPRISFRVLSLQGSGKETVYVRTTCG